MSGAVTVAEVVRVSPTRQKDVPADAFVDVRDPHTGKLLFRYDPVRELIQIVRRRIKILVDLNDYKIELT